MAPERLWTPWRMRYISGNAREDGCIFCNRLNAADDVASLILQRGEYAFIIMNLFPYNTGHVMIVPNQHAADLAELDAPTLHEMADLLPIATTALRRVLDCDGFNAGLNIGDVAGAGIVAHVHQHLVPRWVGDANFMPIIASTMVMPELIPASYAKIRAEIERERDGDRPCVLVVLLDDDQQVLFHNGSLPSFAPESDNPIWKSAVEFLQPAMTEIEIAGWSGRVSAEASNNAGFVVRGTVRSGGDPAFTTSSVQETLRIVAPDAKQTLLRGLNSLRPSIAPTDD